jgi:hypothetical protein
LCSISTLSLTWGYLKTVRSSEYGHHGKNERTLFGVVCKRYLPVTERYSWSNPEGLYRRRETEYSTTSDVKQKFLLSTLPMQETKIEMNRKQGRINFSP